MIWVELVVRKHFAFSENETGGIAAMAALSMPIILSAAVLGAEGGAWALQHQKMQGAADTAALSGIVSKSNSTALTLQSRAVTAAHGFAHNVNNISVAVNTPPSKGAYKSKSGAIEIIITQPYELALAKIFSLTAITISARAVAIQNPGGACLLALNGSASGAVTVQGSAQILLNSCDAVSNSSSASAISAGGSSLLSVNKAIAVGTVSTSNNLQATSGIYNAAPSTVDPYAAQNFAPLPSGCTQNYSGGNATLQPGVYCNGISLTGGANVTLSPGTYYLDASDLRVAGNAKLSGTGVTIVFTSSKGKTYGWASVASNATINLSAPTSGPTAGIVLFGDRNMPQGTVFKLTGGGTQNWTGAIYLPRANLTFAGGTTGGNGCTQIVADTVTFTGNSNLSLSCAGAGTSAMGTQMALLVE